MRTTKIFAIYILLCVTVGVVAKSRGRTGLGWAVLALFITPVMAGALILLLRQGTGPKSPWR